MYRSIDTWRVLLLRFFEELFEKSLLFFLAGDGGGGEADCLDRGGDRFVVKGIVGDDGAGLGGKINSRALDRKFIGKRVFYLGGAFGAMHALDRNGNFHTGAPFIFFFSIIARFLAFVKVFFKNDRRTLR